MKIRYNNAINQQYLLNNNRQFVNSQALQQLTNDTFTKISFGETPQKNNDFSKRINDFSARVMKMGQKQIYDLSAIQSVVNRYAKDVIVEEQTSAPSIYTMGTTVLEIGLNNKNQPVYSKRKLLIDKSKKTEPNARMANLVHEFVHICQSETDEKSKLTPYKTYIAEHKLFEDCSEESCGDNFDEYLKTHEKEKTLINSMQPINNAARQLECGFREITRSIQGNINLNNFMLCNNEKLFNNYCNESIENFMKHNINRQFRQIQKSIPNCDKNLFCSYLKKHMETEKEAYQFEQQFREKTGTSTPGIKWENTFNDLLYKKAIECASNMIDKN